jgi:hypothetical protein
MIAAPLGGEDPHGRELMVADSEIEFDSVSRSAQIASGEDS